MGWSQINTTQSLNAKDNPTQTINEVGLQTNTAYNTLGQVASVTSAAQSNVSSIPVVNAGIASTIAPASRKVTLGYNAAGDLAVVTDPLGNEARITTDALGRPASSTDPLSYKSQTQYNLLDQPTTSTNALGQSTQLSYDSAGRIRQKQAQESPIPRSVREAKNLCNTESLTAKNHLSISQDRRLRV